MAENFKKDKIKVVDELNRPQGEQLKKLDRRRFWVKK